MKSIKFIFSLIIALSGVFLPSNAQNPSAKIGKTWVQNNVTVNNVRGLNVHAALSVSGMRNHKTNVVVLFYDKNYKRVYAPHAESNYLSAEKYLWTWTSLMPTYDNTSYNDVSTFIPYSQFPKNLSGQTLYYKVFVNGIEKGWLPEQSPFIQFQLANLNGNIGSSNPTAVHEWVDLGLSVKWAATNIGATLPSDYGQYFAWGETKTKNIFEIKNYKHCRGDYESLTKYCNNSRYGIVDKKRHLDTADDAAHANWGGRWRMPTEEEIIELRSIKCVWEWTSQNGHNGYRVTGPNGRSIFLPAGGCMSDEPIRRNTSCYYWISSKENGNDPKASCFHESAPSALDFFPGASVLNEPRHIGCSIRAVTDQ